MHMADPCRFASPNVSRGAMGIAPTFYEINNRRRVSNGNHRQYGTPIGGVVWALIERPS